MNGLRMSLRRACQIEAVLINLLKSACCGDGQGVADCLWTVRGIRSRPGFRCQFNTIKDVAMLHGLEPLEGD